MYVIYNTNNPYPTRHVAQLSLIMFYKKYKIIFYKTKVIHEKYCEHYDKKVLLRSLRFVKNIHVSVIFHIVS
jgi:hypothetical protein